MENRKEWTIMVYMAGDNNLSIEMVYALEQLKAVAKENPFINLYVYFDGLSSDVPTLYCDFSEHYDTSDPNRPVNFYQSYKIKNKLIRAKADFNENSAAVNNIINFVDWCVKKDSPEQIKEKKYAFIFSGHSFGFLNWGLFKDEKADYYMTHDKLKYMFERITWTEAQLNEKADQEEAKFREKYGKDWSESYDKSRRTQILGKSLDLLGFDSCVMSTLELGCQFRKFAKTMVASEGSIPTAGWNYAQILLGTINKPKSEPKEIAVSFVDNFIKQQNKFALADISVDISAWDLTNMSDLEKDFAELSKNLIECFKDRESVVFNQMRRLLISAHWQCQTYMFEQHIDLGDFCQLLAAEIDLLKNEIASHDISPILQVGDSCKKVIESIRECILLTGFSGSDFQFSTGISLFFPWSLASYKSAREDYECLTFIELNTAGILWNKFLKIYLSDTTLRKSIPLTQIGEDGKIISTSVIYESYANMNDPNAGFIVDFDTSVNTKQPPNSGRQPPNSGRLLNDISLFLSRFMRLKNFQFNWNRTGFTSKKVGFETLPEMNGAPVPGQIQANKTDKPLINIPRPRGIEKEIDDVKFKLNELGKREYVKVLDDVFKHSDEPTIVSILDDLSRSDFFNFGVLNEEDLKIDLKNAFSKSVSSISDEKIKKGMLENFDKSNLK
jgi:hypothetical protein